MLFFFVSLEGIHNMATIDLTIHFSLVMNLTGKHTFARKSATTDIIH